MAAPEQLQSPEEELSHVDVLIALGRNFQPDFDRKTLAQQRFHLSPGSRINALVTGLLYEAGLADTLLLSTGHTSGSNVPSEAQAMKDYMQGIFKDIPDEAFLLEETSIDTEGNLREIQKILLQHPEFETVGLLTDTSQLKRVTSPFAQAGISVKPFDSLKILGEKRPEFVEHYIQSELYQNTEKQDRKAQLMQSLPIISPITSRLLHQIALHRRNPNKINPYMEG
jgi:hypothetical protein